MTITRTGDTSVRLEWSHPEDFFYANIKTYRIKQRLNDQEWLELGTTKGCVAFATNFECCNMTKDNQYTFCITAVNMLGEGSPLVSEKYKLKSGGKSLIAYKSTS